MPPSSRPSLKGMNANPGYSGSEVDKAKTEMLNTICLKVLDTFLAKNLTQINTELILPTDCKRVSEQKYMQSTTKFRIKLKEYKHFYRFMVKPDRSDVCLQLETAEVSNPSRFNRVTDGATHRQIVEDIGDNGNKSKYSFLLKYDQAILKDPEILTDEINHSLIRNVRGSYVGLNNFNQRMEDTDDFDYHHFKES